MLKLNKLKVFMYAIILNYQLGCQMGFRPKILIWVNLGGSWIGKGWYILWPFEIYYGHFGTFYEYFKKLLLFGIFSPVLVYCVKEKSGSPVLPVVYVIKMYKA
jgi:hypothetical protein